MPDVNDGVLAVSGLTEGLSLLVQSAALPAIVVVAAIAGAVSVAGVRYAEEAAEREIQLDVIEEEQRLLELAPEEELEELVQHFQDKGVSESTARQVAAELNAADALAAQLETEYGIREVVGTARPLSEAAGSGLSFLIGAAVPVTIARIVPLAWVEEYVLLGVLVSLVVTALVLSRLGGTRVLSTILRSLVIGAASLGASGLAGAVLTSL